MTKPLLTRKMMSRLLEMARNASSGTAGLFRVETPAEGIDPLQWLKAAELFPKTYWRNRENTLELAGMGVAWEASGHHITSFGDHLAHAASLLQRAPAGLRCFAAMRFDPHRQSAKAWEAYGSYRLWIPRFEVVQREGASTAAYNGWANTSRDSLAAEWRPYGEVENYQIESATSVLTQREDIPDREAWNVLVRDALSPVSQETIEKVVLARETRLSFARNVDPPALLSRLKEQHSDNFLFGFQLDRRQAFVGAPPERLYKRENRHVQSEAVAGTRPRGATSEEDDVNADALLASAKDRREHHFVEQNIEAALSTLCETYCADEHVSIMRLPHCQHLVRRYRGVLNAGHTDAELLLSLHPTPAVGGVPTASAMQFLRDHEPFDRGWYAGPVGWISAESAEFAVAIRSARIDGDGLSLYSGAGVVRESVPDLEWTELETKIGAFLDALSVR